MPTAKKLPNHDLHTAIQNVIGDLDPIKKDATNPFFSSTYITLKRMRSVLAPILEKHKLWVFHKQVNEGGIPALHTTVAHYPSGEHEESVSLLRGDKVGPQADGSALSYHTRYALQTLFQIDGTDDDGEAAEVGPELAKEEARGHADVRAAHTTPASAGQDKQAAFAAPPSKDHIRLAFKKIEMADDYDKLNANKDKIIAFSRRIEDRLVGLQIQGNLNMKLGELSDAKKKVTIASVSEELGLMED